MHSLKSEEPSLLQRILTYSFRGIAIIMIPIAANVPSVSLYPKFIILTKFITYII